MSIDGIGIGRVLGTNMSAALGSSSCHCDGCGGEKMGFGGVMLKLDGGLHAKTELLPSLKILVGPSYRVVPYLR